MRPLKRKNSSGFTLIELITVIVILGVLSAAVTTFIKFGTQIYSETTARDQLVSSARFAVERLNREVRNALPNSLETSNNDKCLKFTPILESTIYTDIPVSPEPNSNTIKVIEFDVPYDGNWSAVVYPLTTDDVYGSNNKVHAVSNTIDTTGDEWTITLKNAISFAADSPTQRLYFINGTVEYCLQGEQLLRTDSVNSDVLMAQDISNASSSFEVLEATLQRNAMVQIKLLFEKNNEQVSFNNEVQVLNVP